MSRQNFGLYFNRPNLLRVIELREAGLKDTQIARHMKISWDCVLFKLAETTDLDVDDIAVDRALKGDREAFEALTPLERQALGVRVAEAPPGRAQELARAFGIHRTTYEKEIRIHLRRSLNIR